MRRTRLPALVAGLFALAGGLTATQAQDAKGEWTTITGQIKLTTPPPVRPVQVNADKAFCEKDGAVVQEDVIVNPKTKGVKIVIVWLREDDADPKTKRKTPFPADKIHPELVKAAPAERVIDQPCCQFVPRVLAARAGDKLVVKNGAAVAHNTNMSGDQDVNPGLVFNINVPAGGKYSPPNPLAAQPSVIPFKCDIHPWMQGRMRVFDHPYFAVTDDDGKFEIKNAPAGKWRLMIQHENGYHKGREGIDGMPVDIKGATLELPPIELELASLKAPAN